METKRSWADFYQGICRNRAILEGNILEHAPQLEEIARFLRVGYRVLEVGSGTGVMGWPFAQAGVKVTSLDNDPEIIEMAKVNARLLGANIEFVLGDAFNLPFGDGVFNVVFSGGFFEHFEDGDIVKLVREQQRVGEVVNIAVPLLGNKSPSFGDERWLTREYWERVFEPLGLSRSFTYGTEIMGCFTLVREGSR